MSDTTYIFNEFSRQEDLGVTHAKLNGTFSALISHMQVVSQAYGRLTVVEGCQPTLGSYPAVHVDAGKYVTDNGALHRRLATGSANVLPGADSVSYLFFDENGVLTVSLIPPTISQLGVAKVTNNSDNTGFASLEDIRPMMYREGGSDIRSITSTGPVLKLNNRSGGPLLEGFNQATKNLTIDANGNISFAGVIAGDGSGLDNLHASNIATGIVPLDRISGLLDANLAANANIDWTKISKTGSSLAHLAIRSASDLSSGTLPDARFPATLPALNGSNLTNLTSANLVGALPAISGAALLSLNGSQVTTGTVADARLTTNVVLRDAPSNTLAGHLTVGQNLTVTGDLTVLGNATTLNTANLDVEDKIVRVNVSSGADVAVPSGFTGLLIERGSTGGVKHDVRGLLWQESASRFVLGTLTADETGLSSKADLAVLALTADGTLTVAGASTLTGLVTSTAGFSGPGGSLTGLNASQLTAGTIPDGRFPATLPAVSGANLTALNAAQLTSGIIPDARFPATLPARNGSLLTALNGSQITTGTVADARLTTNVAFYDAASPVFAGNMTVSGSFQSTGLATAKTGVRLHSATPGANQLQFMGSKGIIKTMTGGSGNGDIWFNVWDGATAHDALVIKETGRVLVGTTTDDGANQLQVVGNTKLTGTLAAGNTTLTSNAQTLSLVGVDHSYLGFMPRGMATGRKGYIGFDTGATTAFTIANEDTGGIKLQTIGGTVTISTGGKLLMGTSTDNGTDQIQLTGSAYVGSTLFTGDDITVGADGAGNRAVTLRGPAANQSLKIGTYPGYNAFNSSAQLVLSALSGNLVFHTSSLERARFTANGRFLIGTTTDDGSNILQVVGGTKFTGAVYATGLVSSDSGYRAIDPSTPAYGFNIHMTSMGSAWAREFRVTHESNPDGASSALLSFGALGNATGGLDYGYIGGKSTTATSHVSPWMCFRPDGRVGIGTISPEAGRKLHVAGSTRTTDLVVDSAAVLNGGVTVSGGDIVRIGAAAADIGFRSYVTGDSISRFSATVAGILEWGPGTGARDTNLYRSAANTLKTDDTFVAGGAFWVTGNANVGTNLLVTGTATLSSTLDVAGAITSAALTAVSGQHGQSLFKHAGGWGGITIAGPANASAAVLTFSNDADNAMVQKWRLIMNGADNSIGFYYGGVVGDAPGTAGLLLNAAGAMTLQGGLTATTGNFSGNVVVNGGNLYSNGGQSLQIKGDSALNLASGGSVIVMIDDDNTQTDRAFAVRSNGVTGTNLFMVNESGGISWAATASGNGSGITNLTAANLSGVIPAASFNDTAHGSRAGGALHALATESTHGFMSATDKAALNGLVAGTAGVSTFNGRVGLVTLTNADVMTALNAAATNTLNSNFIVNGDVTINGTMTTLSSTELQIEDRLITINKTTGTAPVPSQFAGIEVMRGNDGVSDRNKMGLVWNEAGAHWTAAELNSSGAIVARTKFACATVDIGGELQFTGGTPGVFKSTAPFQFMTGASAQRILVGSILVSNNYGDPAPPTNGIRAKGEIHTDASVKAGGTLLQKVSEAPFLTIRTHGMLSAGIAGAYDGFDFNGGGAKTLGKVVVMAGKMPAGGNPDLVVDILYTTTPGGTPTTLYTTKTKPTVVANGGTSWVIQTGAALPDVTTIPDGAAVFVQITQAPAGTEDLLVQLYQ